MADIFTAACVQCTSSNELDENLDMLTPMIREAAALGADLVLLPEMCTLLEMSSKNLFARAQPEETDPGKARFANLAKELGIWLHGGSVPIKLSDTQVANRTYVFNPDGQVVGQYDKIHMFDVDLDGGESYRESKNYKPGEQAALAHLPWGKLGLTICYDVRFAYLYRALAQAGAKMLCVPAAFTQPTGAAHWHVLLRARAIETGCYVFAPAQTGSHADGRKTYGHALIIAPWGEVLADAGTKPGVIISEIDLDKVDKARGKVPALSHDRDFRRP